MFLDQLLIEKVYPISIPPLKWYDIKIAELSDNKLIKM